MHKISSYLGLHALFLLYAMGGVCSKLASGYPFMSVRFIIYYGGVLAILFVYAVFWQQALHRFPLTVASANKAITVLWGMVLGGGLFGESITPEKWVGSGLIILGVILFSDTDDMGENPDGMEERICPP